MAYEFQIDELEGPYTDEEGSQIVEFILGFDVEQDSIVVMAVILFPTTDPNALELCFGIRTKTASGEVSGPDYGREGADLYIPREYRAQVLAKVRESIALVVAAALPASIVMETFYPALPPQALQKYDGVAAAVIGCGYRLEDSFRDTENGINYWLFGKL